MQSIVYTKHALFTCRMTMKNRIPQAIGTLYLIMTITQPPSCPNKLTITKSVARILPQPHDISIYSLCSFHWNHILRPSSKNVDIKHNLATVGKIYFAFLVTYNMQLLIPYGNIKKLTIYCKIHHTKQLALYKTKALLD